MGPDGRIRAGKSYSPHDFLRMGFSDTGNEIKYELTLKSPISEYPRNHLESLDIGGIIFQQKDLPPFKIKSIQGSSSKNNIPRYYTLMKVDAGARIYNRGVMNLLVDQPNGSCIVHASYRGDESILMDSCIGSFYEHGFLSRNHTVIRMPGDIDDREIKKCAKQMDIPIITHDSDFKGTPNAIIVRELDSTITNDVMFRNIYEKYKNIV